MVPDLLFQILVATIVRDCGLKHAKETAALTSFFYFTLRGADLLLFYAGSIWIESPKLLSLLPCEDTIGPMLVLCRWHLILLNG
jgi:hypothetical protein